MLRTKLLFLVVRVAVEKGKGDMVYIKLSNHYAALVEAEQAVCQPWVIEEVVGTSQAFDETEVFSQGRVMA